MHSHRVEVLDRADDNDVVGKVLFLRNFVLLFVEFFLVSIVRNLSLAQKKLSTSSFFLTHPHHFELEFLPAQQRLLDENLVGQRRGDAGGDDLLKLVHVVRDATAGAAQRERGPDDQGELADHLVDRQGLLHRRRRPRGGGVEPDVLHGVLEELAVLGLVDRGELGADELDAVPEEFWSFFGFSPGFPGKGERKMNRQKWDLLLNLRERNRERRQARTAKALEQTIQGKKKERKSKKS